MRGRRSPWGFQRTLHTTRATVPGGTGTDATNARPIRGTQLTMGNATHGDATGTIATRNNATHWHATQTENSRRNEQIQANSTRARTQPTDATQRTQPTRGTPTHASLSSRHWTWALTLTLTLTVANRADAHRPDTAKLEPCDAAPRGGGERGPRPETSSCRNQTKLQTERLLCLGQSLVRLFTLRSGQDPINSRIWVTQWSNRGELGKSA